HNLLEQPSNLMPKRAAYRYDDADYKDGKVIKPRGDFFESLTQAEKLVEVALRKMLPNGPSVCGASICTWEDKLTAERIWGRSKKRYLYELEVEKEDIRFRGDVNFYSDAADKAKLGMSFTSPLSSYCNGDPPTSHHTGPRVEILVSKATVISKLKDRYAGS